MKCSIAQIAAYAAGSGLSELFNEIYLNKVIEITFRHLAVLHAMMTGSWSDSHAARSGEQSEYLLSTLQRQ